MTDRDALIERVKALDFRGANMLVPVADLRALISLASPSPAQTETLECVNCGSREGIDAIKARGQISCCPERKMRPPSPAQWPEGVARIAGRFSMALRVAEASENNSAVVRCDDLEVARAALATLPPPASKGGDAPSSRKTASQEYDDAPGDPLPGAVLPPPEDERVKGLERALEPFATVGRLVAAGWGPRGVKPDDVFHSGMAWRDKDGATVTLTFGHFEDARSALASYRGGA